jgi:hypothetical protein
MYVLPQVMKDLHYCGGDETKENAGQGLLSYSLAITAINSL